MDYATRLAALCSREPGLTALLSLPAQGDAAVFWLLCTEASMASMPRVLPRLAADAGALAASAPEGEGLLCLYDGQPRMVLLRPLPANHYVSTPDAALLWWKERWWLSLPAGAEQAAARLSEFGRSEADRPHLEASLAEYGRMILTSDALAGVLTYFPV